MGDEDEEGGILGLSETRREGFDSVSIHLFLDCTMVLYIPERQLDLIFVLYMKLGCLIL